MSVGGSTWETAGVLELGSGNTFTVADATEDSEDIPGFVEAAWWTLTPAASALVTLGHSDPSAIVVYVGDDYASRDDVNPVDFDGDSPIYTLQQGVVYHVLMVHDEFDSPTTYQVTWAEVALTATGWKTGLRDRTDNEVIVSRYELVQLNQNPAFQGFPDWMHSVIRWDGVDNARPGEFSAIEIEGGDDPNGAESCCWAHAVRGEFNGQLWTGPEQDEDNPSTAVCFPLTGVSAAPNSTVDAASYTVQAAGPPPGVFAARTQSASVTILTRALYFLPVLDNTDPFGGLSSASPDPYADGVPLDATNITLEFESPHCDLLGVDFTGDFPDRDSVPGLGDEARIALRDDLARPFAPSDETGGTYGTYTVGVPGTWDETGAGYLTNDFNGSGADPDWVEIDGAASGVDGWDGKADYTSEDSDERALIGMLAAWGGSGYEQDLHTSFLDIALRFRLQSPRYRWVFEGELTTSIPPRRIFQRSDGKTHGAARVGRGNTRQSGSRTLGAIL